MSTLNMGSFAPCSKYWDGAKYIDATPDQQYKCCNSKCIRYSDICGNSDSCDSMTQVCNKVCQSVRYDPYIRHFDKCMVDIGCLKNDILNYDCIKKNKDQLISCCINKCDNCDEHCKISYDINLERSLPDNNSKKYYWVLMLLVFLVIILVILYKMNFFSFNKIINS